MSRLLLNLTTEFKDIGSKDTCYLTFVSPPEVVYLGLGEETQSQLIERAADTIMAHSKQTYLSIVEPDNNGVQLIFGTNGGLCLTLGTREYDKVLDMEELKSKNVVKTVESEGELYLVIILKKYLEQLAKFASVAFEKTLGHPPVSLKLCIVSNQQDANTVFHNIIPTQEKSKKYGRPDRYVDVSEYL